MNLRTAALAFLWLSGCSARMVITPEPTASSSPHSSQNSTMNVPFQIGETVIQAAVFQQGQTGPTMINVHSDEDTSVAAGKAVILESGGRLIQLVHGGRRHVSFRLEGQSFCFDPNRIFSDAGIRATLAAQSTWTRTAHAAVRSFAAQYLERFGLERERVVVALHNTEDGDYSIESYRAGAEHAAAAADLHISPNRSRFDFFYVTEPRFFDWLRQRDYNVILQAGDGVPDDGSLSVHFARRGVPYVNIEARMDHLETQVEMVRAACRMVSPASLGGE